MIYLKGQPRHVQKARINVHDELAEALHHAHQRLKTQADQHNDLDAEIQVRPLSFILFS